MRYQDNIPVTTAVMDDKNDNPYSYGSTATSDTPEIVKGELQPPAYRDVGFAVCFWIQIVVVVSMCFAYATGKIEVDWSVFTDIDIDEEGTARRMLSSALGAEDNATDDDDTLNWYPLLWGSVSALAIAPCLTVAMMTFLSRNAVALIEASLYGSIGLNVLLVVVCAISGIIWAALLAGAAAMITYCYARLIWERIPLAAANLKTGVASLQAQLGVAFLGVTSLPLYTIWWVMWMYFFVASLNTPYMLSQKIQNSSDQEGYTAMWYFLCFLMLVSFYWTHQVIGNTIQATVAGSVGTFWFVPVEATGCCSPALSSSLYRSLTYSFGSICMGSLLVAIIQAARNFVRMAEDQARQEGNGFGTLFLCLSQCILSMLEAIAEFFNKWAFIYVGLYGYSYLDAGKNVITLFRSRGWSTLISDNLTTRVLGLMSFAIGLGTGLLSALVAGVSAAVASSPGGEIGGMAAGSLFIAFFVGMLVASIVMTVVGSAVDTVIVLFAEAPMEFQQNHPILSEEMNRAWASGYPEMFTQTVPTVVV